MQKTNTIIFERSSWYFRYKEIDEKNRIRYLKKGGYATKEEAEYAAFLFEERRKQEQMNNGQLGRQIRTALFKDYMQEWFENRDSLSGTTRLVYTYVLEVVLPEIGTIRLGNINSSYLNQLIIMVSQRTASYGEKLYELFHMAIGDAFQKGLLSYNPMTDVKKPARRKKRLVHLNEEQRKALFQAAFACEGRMELFLALLCGLKKGEIYGLKFTDFNMKEKTVHIQRQVQLDSEKNNTGALKSTEKGLSLSSDRIISVHPLILEELTRRKFSIELDKKATRTEYKDHGYVSCQKDGSCKSPAYMNTMLCRLCKKAGLPSLSVQDLRDQYAAILLEQGNVSFLQLKGLLGYSTIEDVYERYSGLIEAKANIANAVNQIFAGYDG